MCCNTMQPDAMRVVLGFDYDTNATADKFNIICMTVVWKHSYMTPSAVVSFAWNLKQNVEWKYGGRLFLQRVRIARNAERCTS